MDHFNIEYKIIYDYDVLTTYKIKHILNILINNIIVNNNINDDIKLFEFFKQSALNNMYSSKINKHVNELYIKSKSKSKKCDLTININNYKTMLINKYMNNFLTIDDNTNLNFYNKIFLWNKNMNDLEGVAFNILNINEFNPINLVCKDKTKEKNRVWPTISAIKINNELKNNIDNKCINDLKQFITKKVDCNINFFSYQNIKAFLKDL